MSSYPKSPYSNIFENTRPVGISPEFAQLLDPPYPDEDAPVVEFLRGTAGFGPRDAFLTALETEDRASMRLKRMVGFECLNHPWGSTGRILPPWRNSDGTWKKAQKRCGKAPSPTRNSGNTQNNLSEADMLLEGKMKDSGLDSPRTVQYIPSGYDKQFKLKTAVKTQRSLALTVKRHKLELRIRSSSLQEKEPKDVAKQIRRIPGRPSIRRVPGRPSSGSFAQFHLPHGHGAY